jgi:hypothetical protein
LGSECPLIGSEPACGISAGIAKKAVSDWTENIKILGVLNRTQTGKEIPNRTLCQKNRGTVKTKQEPVTAGDRTTYRVVT